MRGRFFASRANASGTFSCVAAEEEQAFEVLRACSISVGGSQYRGCRGIRPPRGGKHRQQYFHLESKLAEPLQPGRWLALAAAVLLVTEWFLHHRRVHGITTILPRALETITARCAPQRRRPTGNLVRAPGGCGRLPIVRRGIYRWPIAPTPRRSQGSSREYRRPASWHRED